jgi:hypothetical protein
MDAAHASRGGFIAGTLVLTREGQVKIEQLRLGDLVRVQDDDGASVWQPVVRVFTLADQPVHEILYFVDDGSDEQLPIYATGGIAVLTAEFGWPRFDEEERGVTVQLADRLEAWLVLSQAVRRTSWPSIGYVALDEYGNEDRMLDFGDEAMEIHVRPSNGPVVPDDGGDPRLRVTVHGVELAAGRTFYVGHRNVLVRDGLDPAADGP